MAAVTATWSCLSMHSNTVRSKCARQGGASWWPQWPGWKGQAVWWLSFLPSSDVLQCKAACVDLCVMSGQAACMACGLSSIEMLGMLTVLKRIVD